MRDFSGTPKIRSVTLHDMVHAMTIRCGGQSTDMGDFRIVKAIQSAIMSLHSKHPWRYYRRQVRFNTSAQQVVQITYDHTGGTNERQATLSSGTWPTDATYGELLIGEKTYRIEERVSDTVVTLESDFSLSEDYSGGATWQRRSYQLPREMTKVFYVQNMETQLPLFEVSADEYSSDMYTPYTSGYAQNFTWQNTGGRFGASEITIWPAPTASQIIEVSASVVPHKPTINIIDGDDLSGTSGSKEVGFDATTFDSSVIGSVIRISKTGNAPKGFSSDEHAFEAFIVGLDGESTLLISEPLTESFTDSGFAISSPIDIETSVMLEAVEDEAYYQYTKNHDHQGRQEAAQMARKSFIESVVRDNRSTYPKYFDTHHFSVPLAFTETSE